MKSLILVGLLVCIGCGDDDVASSDARVEDSAVVDSSALDSSTVDSSLVDSSAVDSSLVDSSAVDSSAVDSSVADSGNTCVYVAPPVRSALDKPCTAEDLNNASPACRECIVTESIRTEVEGSKPCNAPHLMLSCCLGRECGGVFDEACQNSGSCQNEQAAADGCFQEMDIVAIDPAILSTCFVL